LEEHETETDFGDEYERIRERGERNQASAAAERRYRWEGIRINEPWGVTS
jgi:hypothetical protein